MGYRWSPVALIRLLPFWTRVSLEIGQRNRSSTDPEIGAAEFCKPTEKVILRPSAPKSISTRQTALPALTLHEVSDSHDREKHISYTGVQFDVDVRREGPSSWNFWRLWNFALTGLTSFSTLPLRIWSYTGAIVALLAILYATAIIVQTVLYGIEVPGYATIVVLILFLGGIQLLSIGILGEYISRIFEETKQRPLYLVDYKSTFGFKGLT